MTAPVPGATRYLCPLECGWHHDRPPLSVEQLGDFNPGPTAASAQAAFSAAVEQAMTRDIQRVETAIRSHLATHPIEAYVAAIQQLRGEVDRLTGAVRP